MGAEDLLVKVLGIHLIIQEIGKYLTLPDLISCSAVNRHFCARFREYIHDSRNCLIKITWNMTPCVQLRELNELLKRSKFSLPFNGVPCSEFEIEDPNNPKVCSSCSSENHENVEEERYDALLSKVRFTSFVLFWPRYLPEKFSCPAIRFVEAIMTLKAGYLRVLTVWTTLRVNSLLDYFKLDTSTRLCWLAKLHTFNLGVECNEFSSTVRNKHLQEILESSPNLKIINGPFRGEMFEQTCNSGDNSGIVPTNKLAFIKVAYGLSASQLSRLAKERPRLRYLGLYSRRDGSTFPRLASNDRKDGDVAVKLLNGLFQSSYNSLRVLRCKLFQLSFFSREVSKASWPLMNVATLDLLSTEEELSYFKYMNVQQMFPQVREIYLTMFWWTTDLDPKLLAYESDFEYVDSTVKRFHLHDYIPEEYLKILALTFPNITNFTYHHCEQIPEMCAALWKIGWENMETIKFCSLQVNFDFDDNLFGLTPDEREFIEAEQLDPRGYHHTFSKYSAFNLKCLKTLKLEMDECQYFPPSTFPQKFPLISRIVAENIPNNFHGLDIQITIDPRHISHEATICDDPYSTLVKHPGFYRSKCEHRFWYPHGFHGINQTHDKKTKFTVTYK